MNPKQFNGIMDPRASPKKPPKHQNAADHAKILNGPARAIRTKKSARKMREKNNITKPERNRKKFKTPRSLYPDKKQNRKENCAQPKDRREHTRPNVMPPTPKQMRQITLSECYRPRKDRNRRRIAAAWQETPPTVPTRLFRLTPRQR